MLHAKIPHGNRRGDAVITNWSGFLLTTSQKYYLRKISVDNDDGDNDGDDDDDDDDATMTTTFVRNFFKIGRVTAMILVQKSSK